MKVTEIRKGSIRQFDFFEAQEHYGVDIIEMSNGSGSNIYEVQEGMKGQYMLKIAEAAVMDTRLVVMALDDTDEIKWAFLTYKEFFDGHINRKKNERQA